MTSGDPDAKPMQSGQPGSPPRLSFLSPSHRLRREPGLLLCTLQAVAPCGAPLCLRFLPGPGWEGSKGCLLSEGGLLWLGFHWVGGSWGVAVRLSPRAALHPPARRPPLTADPLVLAPSGPDPPPTGWVLCVKLPGTGFLGSSTPAGLWLIQCWPGDPADPSSQSLHSSLPLPPCAGKEVAKSFSQSC